MEAWWAALTALERICLYVAVPATLVLVVQTILMFIGLGGDGDMDGPDLDGIDMDGDGVPDQPADDDLSETAGSGLKLITLRGVVAFLAVSGWGGLWLLRLGLAGWLAVVLAVQMGVWAMLLLALAVRWLMRLEEDGTLRPEKAIGLSGSVYLTIPARRAGEGKVMVLVQEQLGEFEAVTDGERALPTGGRIKVTGVLENGALVVEAEEEEEERTWRE